MKGALLLSDFTNKSLNYLI